MNSNNLVQHLIAKKIFTEESWKALELEAVKAKLHPEELLVRKGILSESQLAEIKADLFGLPFLSLEGKKILPETLKIIPQSVAENYQLIVFEKTGKDVSVALVDPSDYRAIEAIDFWAKKEGYSLHLFITTFSDYRNAAKGYTEFNEEVSEALEVLEKRREQEKQTRHTERLSEVIRKAPVTKIVQLMIQEAVDANTSDIHVEPGQDEARVRFRVDGVLRTYLSYPLSFHSSIISRIKVLADLKIDETRIPQDGRIRMDVYGQDINLRVSTLPLMGSEKVVMRILPTSSKVITLADLGFWGPALEELQRIIERPTGVLLVSGPTGSGKSTTLYSILTALNKDTGNITTLEDPVEYFLSGVNQVQINPDVGLTFVSGLRAILRQDPKIVMVGEIRDNETAELATHAALTGHFMLSTIHAKDVLGVIPRLIDMHVEPFLISAALNTITAQRLVRKICQACKIPADAIPERLEKEIRAEIEKIPSKEAIKDISLDGKLAFYKGAGCDKCGGSGYKGRTVAVELISMSEQLEEIMNSKFSREDLQNEMSRQGKMTIKQDAIIKSLRGLTTVEEFLRVTRE
jgi:type IV pilus assembly protein PilB